MSELNGIVPGAAVDRMVDLGGPWRAFGSRERVVPGMLSVLSG